MSQAAYRAAIRYHGEVLSERDLVAVKTLIEIIDEETGTAVLTRQLLLAALWLARIRRDYPEIVAEAKPPDAQIQDMVNVAKHYLNG